MAPGLGEVIAAVPTGAVSGDVMPAEKGVVVALISEDDAPELHALRAPEKRVRARSEVSRIFDALGRTDMGVSLSLSHRGQFERGVAWGDAH